MLLVIMLPWTGVSGISPWIDVKLELAVPFKFSYPWFEYSKVRYTGTREQKTDPTQSSTDH